MNNPAITRRQSNDQCPFPKFVIQGSEFGYELWKHRGTSKLMILVPLSI